MSTPVSPSSPVPYSAVDRKTSADYDADRDACGGDEYDADGERPPPRATWRRSLLFWLVAVAGAGVVTVTALSARALGTHTGRHAYPHVLAESDSLSRAADAGPSLAMLPMHDIDRHFSLLVGLAGELGVPVAIPLMGGGVILLAFAIYLLYRPRHRELAPRHEISLTSRRRRARVK